MNLETGNFQKLIITIRDFSLIIGANSLSKVEFEWCWEIFLGEYANKPACEYLHEVPSSKYFI